MKHIVTIEVETNRDAADIVKDIRWALSVRAPTLKIDTIKVKSNDDEVCVEATSSVTDDIRQDLRMLGRRLSALESRLPPTWIRSDL